MRISSNSPLREVAAVVARALREAGIEAILTGGGCATIYSRGQYQSSDLDFVLESRVSQRQLDSAMESAGFRRRVGHYVHSRTPFFVEFPRGPLSIGRDDAIQPVELKIGKERARALSATDSCRDRLAAYYFWDDLSSLKTAMAIARRQKVSISAIGRWSKREGQVEKFKEFQHQLARSKKPSRE